MQKEKKKTADNTDDDGLTKVQVVSSEVDDFVEEAYDIKKAIDYLMEAIESLGQRLDLVLDDDDIAVSDGRKASTLFALLAEQAEKLKNEATTHQEYVDRFLNQ